jgi:hypothetical protein
LPGQDGLKVGREAAGPNAPKEVVRYVGCQALELAKKLRRLPVALLLMHEELTNALVP